MNMPFALSFFLLLFVGTSCNSAMKSYPVKKISQPINITGKGTDAAWEMANELSDFSYPWRTEKAPATNFKALYTEDQFYFLYRASAKNIITQERNRGEKDVVESDRVEIY